MSASSTDVFIVGGGPAGLAAAIALRQEGLSATVADCALPPIDKACGEGLMPDSLEALRELGVTLEHCETGEFQGISFIGPHSAVSADFPHGLGLGIRRTLLHGVLMQRAADLGVEMLWGVRVSGIRKDAVLLGDKVCQCKWIVGADGQNSQVRKWAGLSQKRDRDRRIALRQHFAVPPWSRYVEIYWGDEGQAYVTPISPSEMCVALISTRSWQSFESGILHFPALAACLAHGVSSSKVRGGVSICSRLRCVFRENVALIGEASGSVDAVTGDGLALTFRQARVLARAVHQKNLFAYQGEHDSIGRRPDFMARAMLLMDKSSWIRSRTLRAFEEWPSLFQRLLSFHVGENGFGSLPGVESLLRTSSNHSHTNL